jgi:hypothetical protein
MKNFRKYTLLTSMVFVVIALTLLSFNDSENPEPENMVSEDYILNSDFQQNWSDCVAKVGSDWGGQCLNYGNSDLKYTVHLVNTCTEQIDLMCAVQRENERWRLFYRMDMNPNDTLSSYACRGNGKYLKWARKAGDVTVKFPSLDEVNEQY